MVLYFDVDFSSRVHANWQSSLDSGVALIGEKTEVQNTFLPVVGAKINTQDIDSKCQAAINAVSERLGKDKWFLGSKWDYVTEMIISNVGN